LIKGFELQKAVQAFQMVRKASDRIDTVTISYKDYSVHGFCVDGVSVDIRFGEVEDLIEPLLEKYSIEHRYGKTTVQKTLHDIVGVDYSFRDIEVKDRRSFEVVAVEVLKIISQGAVPFFERYKSIGVVAEDLIAMPEEAISTFVSGIIGIKVPFIKKIARSVDFADELKERKIFYSSEVFMYPQYFKDHEKVFGELFREDLSMV
jgi:hypothetical protein